VTIWPRKHKRKTPSQAFTRSKQIYCIGRSLKFCGTVHCKIAWQIMFFGQKRKNTTRKQKLNITRGPRGPWVAHLRKRSKVTVDSIIENLRGIIWTTLVEDLLMMLYIKYESTGPCSFRQEDFWKFHFKTYLLTQWPTYTTNWNGLNNFDRGSPRDHSCEVWSNSYKQFKRSCCLKFSLYNSM